MSRLKGIVLAGGKSSRFGSDKALAFYDGEPLLKRAVDLLRELELQPAVITRQGKSYRFLDCAVIEDQLPDLGPLGGLYTAMTAFSHDAFCVLTCDMPFLTKEAVSALIRPGAKNDEMIFFEACGRRQPFPGIYSRRILPQIRRHLLEGRRSFQNLIEQASAKSIPWTNAPEIFANVNVADDLKNIVST